MKPTIDYIEKKFDEFNRMCFNGELPKVPVRLSNAKTFMGKLVWKVVRRPDGKVEKLDYHLRINTRIDLPEPEIEDVILHEMIHYYIELKDLRDTSAHGEIFKSIMNAINVKFGRHITVRHKNTDEQAEQLQDKRRRWHVVALVTISDGRFGLKVLPRIKQSIIAYYNGMISSNTVTKVDFFLTDNPFFNRYPNSSVLRAHFIEREVVERELKGAYTITCDGTRVVVNTK